MDVAVDVRGFENDAELKGREGAPFALEILAGGLVARLRLRLRKRSVKGRDVLCELGNLGKLPRDTSSGLLAVSAVSVVACVSSLALAVRSVAAGCLPSQPVDAAVAEACLLVLLGRSLRKSQLAIVIASG